MCRLAGEAITFEEAENQLYYRRRGSCGRL